MQKKKAISLIVLVITIIVMIVLAGAIILSLNNAGIINRSNEAVFKQNVKNYQSELSLYLGERLAENPKFNTSSLNVDATTTPNIKEVISSISDVDSTEFKVKNGELLYSGKDETKKQWAKEMSIVIEGEEVTENPVLTQSEYETKYATEIATATEVGQVTDGSYSLKQEYIDMGYGENPSSYKIAIPYGVVDVNISGAFVVTDIIFPSTVKSISCLEHVNISELNLPYGLEKISQEAIQSYSIEKINIPDTVTSLEYSSIGGTSITSVKLPKGLLKLEPLCLTNVKELVIPENVEEIAAWAFMSMPIEKVYIESTKLTTVGDSLFEGASNTSGIVVYVRNAEVAKLFEGKYDSSAVTISTDYNWTAPEQ